MKSINKFKNMIIIVLLVSLTGLIAFNYYSSRYSNLEVVNSETIEEKIISLGELATIEYNYKDVLLYEDTKELSGLYIPFTKKSFIIVYGGYVKAGVDLENMNILLDNENNITLLLQNAKFLDNVINEEEVVVYDERSGLFNKLKIEDVFKVLEGEKQTIEDKLIKNGFLKEANTRTEKLLISLLSEMGFNNISIDFR